MTKNFRVKTTHLYRCDAEYQVGVTYSGSDKTDEQFVALEWAGSYVFELPVRRAFNRFVGDYGAGGHICSVLSLNQELELGFESRIEEEEAGCGS